MDAEAAPTGGLFTKNERTLNLVSLACVNGDVRVASWALKPPVRSPRITAREMECRIRGSLVDGPSYFVEVRSIEANGERVIGTGCVIGCQLEVSTICDGEESVEDHRETRTADQV